MKARRYVNKCVEESAVRANRLYTNDELIKQLRKAARKLGRTPEVNDIRRLSKQRKCASVATFANRFGSYSAALYYAGLTPRYGKYSTDELIKQLKELKCQLKRTPTLADIDEASRRQACASRSTFIDRFGSFGLALVAAGLDTKRRGPGRPIKIVATLPIK